MTILVRVADDAVPQAERKDAAAGIAAPSIEETKTLAEEAFIYGMPLVMNYAVMYEYAVDTKSSQFPIPARMRPAKRSTAASTTTRPRFPPGNSHR
jgi:hypothetical protein